MLPSSHLFPAAQIFCVAFMCVHMSTTIALLRNSCHSNPGGVRSTQTATAARHTCQVPKQHNDALPFQAAATSGARSELADQPGSAGRNVPVVPEVDQPDPLLVVFEARFLQRHIHTCPLSILHAGSLRVH